MLPEPQQPGDFDKGAAWYRLRQYLALMAQQDAPVVFAWADMAQFKLTWEEFCTLVPFSISLEAIPGIDLAGGPELAAPVPRRLLACLRDQMDMLAILWLQKQTEEKVKLEMVAEANQFAQKTLDQAKRILDRKRPAETSASKEAKPSVAADGA